MKINFCFHLVSIIRITDAALKGFRFRKSNCIITNSNERVRYLPKICIPVSEARIRKNPTSVGIKQQFYGKGE